VITAFPAIITGIGEAYELIRSEYLRKGSWGKVFDYAWNMKDDEGRKIKMTIKHASMNDMVVALAAWNWCVARAIQGPQALTGQVSRVQAPRRPIADGQQGLGSRSASCVALLCV
jgi:hypothetical protein